MILLKRLDRRHRFTIVRERPRSWIWHCPPCGQFEVQRAPLKPMYRFSRMLRDAVIPVLHDEMMKPNPILARFLQR